MGDFFYANTTLAGTPRLWYMFLATSKLIARRPWRMSLNAVVETPIAFAASFCLYPFWRNATFFYRIIQVSQVTSGPRRGPTFNNRWWNDRRSWNLRTTNSREKASPKGANRIQSCPCSPPLGTVREYLSLSAGSIPFGHSTRGYSHSPPSGTEETDVMN